VDLNGSFKSVDQRYQVVVHVPRGEHKEKSKIERPPPSSHEAGP
jgi:hypothetical protein